jgi:glycosyltransferase involved in cell wall biosynthesis
MALCGIGYPQGIEGGNSMTSVLMVDLSLRYGGADVRVLALAEAFEKRGIPYCVAVLDESDIQRRMQSDGLTNVTLPYGKGNPLVATFLRRLITENQHTVVDAHNPQSQLWSHTATLGMKQIQRVSTMHSSYRMEHEGSVKGYSYEQIIRLNAMQGCRFIAVSEAVNEYLIDTVNVDANRITLIHNSIPIPEQQQHDKTHPLVVSLGWQDKTIVCTVGRLETVKGHEFLIKALKAVKPVYPDLRCLFIGEGRIHDDLEAQVADAGLAEIIHFTGFRDDVTTLLQSTDIFAIPSLSEGLPYALLEAASQKIPILASEVGGMATLLTHRKTAYMIPPSDGAALAEGLRWMLDNEAKRREMAEAAYTLVKENYSIDAMVEQTLNVYQK